MRFFSSMRDAARLPVFAAVLAAAAVTAVASTSAASKAWAAELAAHKAAYVLRLETAKPGSGIANVEGVITVTLEQACAGAWIMSQDTALRLTTLEGREVKTVSHYTGWESADGARFRFATVSNTQGQRTEVRGQAENSLTRPGRIVYRKPRASTEDLPPNTAFPVGHSAWLIDQAAAGARQAPRTVFLGIDGEGARTITAFIGRRREADEKIVAAFGPLTDRPGWLMHTAVYAATGNSPLPEFETRFLALDNGVALDMVITYPGFTVTAALERIVALPPPSC